MPSASGDVLPERVRFVVGLFHTKRPLEANLLVAKSWDGTSALAACDTLQDLEDVFPTRSGFRLDLSSTSH